MTTPLASSTSDKTCSCGRYSLTWTRRDIHVAMMLDTPFTQKEIAKRLHITAGIVHRHTGRVYELLGVHSRFEAITAWRELGRLNDAATPSSAIVTPSCEA